MDRLSLTSPSPLSRSGSSEASPISSTPVPSTPRELRTLILPSEYATHLSGNELSRYLLEYPIDLSMAYISAACRGSAEDCKIIEQHASTRFASIHQNNQLYILPHNGAISAAISAGHLKLAISLILHANSIGVMIDPGLMIHAAALTTTPETTMQAWDTYVYPQLTATGNKYKNDPYDCLAAAFSIGNNTFVTLWEQFYEEDGVVGNMVAFMRSVAMRDGTIQEYSMSSYMLLGRMAQYSSLDDRILEALVAVNSAITLNMQSSTEPNITIDEAKQTISNFAKLYNRMHSSYMHDTRTLQDVVYNAIANISRVVDNISDILARVYASVAPDINYDNQEQFAYGIVDANRVDLIQSLNATALGWLKNGLWRRPALLGYMAINTSTEVFKELVQISSRKSFISVCLTRQAGSEPHLASRLEWLLSSYPLQIDACRDLIDAAVQNPRIGLDLIYFVADWLSMRHPDLFKRKAVIEKIVAYTRPTVFSPKLLVATIENVTLIKELECPLRPR